MKQFSLIGTTNWLARQAMQSIMQPLTKDVANNQQDYLAEAGVEKLGWRHFRKAMQFHISGQRKYLCQRIPDGCKNVLWIYEGIPQIGDALMDLAPRSLIQERGIVCDLLIDAHLAEVFQLDPWFNQIATHPTQLTGRAYDLIILQSNKRRSMLKKIRHFNSHSWLSMHGFYTGPEFHRARFATQRLIDAFGVSISDSNFELHAQQKLHPLERRQSEPRLNLKVALALGGVDHFRVFKYWFELAHILSENYKIEVTLLGSSNASSDASKFARLWNTKTTIVNLVGKTSIIECRNSIAEQDLLVTCDGGLMHLAVTTPVRMVALFNNKVSPAWRLPTNRQHASIRSETQDVSDIPIKKILETIRSILEHHE
jgi:ADP-heptose:LPS heptosyltransferase